MPSNYSSGVHSIAECDVCGFRYKLHQLKPLTIKTKVTNILACPACWTPDQPQLSLGLYPVEDAWAVRNPRPDVSYRTSGTSGLQLSPSDVGTPEGGSRIIEWGWNPVGGARGFDSELTPNVLAMTISLGTVTVSVT